MACETCGAKSECGAASCPACGAELRAEGNHPPARVRTFLALNIVYLLLSLPFCWAVARLLLDLQSLYHGRLLLVKVGLPLAAIFAGGTYLALRSARGVRRLAGENDYKQAAQAALASRRWFARFFALNLILAIFLGVALPPFFSYREKSFDAGARRQLEKVVSLQEQFFAQHGRYAESLDALAGLSGTGEEMEIQLASGDRHCWQASALHRKGRNIIVYDHCREGEGRFSRRRR